MMHHRLLQYARSIAKGLLAAVLLGTAFQPVHAQSVATAAALYNSNVNGTWSACTGCHLSNPAPDTSTNPYPNHLTASNNFAFLKSAMSPGGLMYAQIPGTLPTDDQIRTLSMYIGQYKAPIAANSSASTPQGVAKVIDVYPLLLIDGSSGVAADNGLSAGTPAHGTTSVAINTATVPVQYNITYIPAPGYSGSDSFTFTISNAAGSTTKTITMTVAPVPVISSPTFVNLQTGVTMSSNVQIVASNTPTSYGMTPIPNGLSLNTTTGVISGTPTTPGTTSVTLSATNANGTGTRVVSFTVGTPAPGVCNVSTTFNTATTFDLSSCFGFTDTAHYTVTGMTLLSTPTHGSASISGNNVTYTPANGYFGTDSFTAKGNFQGVGLSSTGTVNITVTGRPDPTKDAAVTGLQNALVETSLRFSRTQAFNYSLHLENLRARNKRTDAMVQSSGFARTQADRPATLQASERLANLGVNNATQLAPGTTPASLPLATGLAFAARESGLGNHPLYAVATGLVQSGQLDLGRLSRGLSDDLSANPPSATKMWLEGVISFGSRDASGTVSATDFSSSGVTVGTDLVISDKLTVGMGLGLAKNTTNIGTDGTRTQARGTSVAVYGSYQTGTVGFVEGMLGVGVMDFDMSRYVSGANAYAVSNRKGYQVFGSLGTGLEFREKSNMISPYLRLDFSTDKLGENTETGAGTYSLTYFDQTNSALQGTLGLRGESTHATPFGWAIPRARVEWRQDLSNRSEAAMAYADQINGTRYAISSSGSQRGAFVLGVGSEFIFRDGWAFGLDYQLTQIANYESSYALRLKLVKELGAKGLPNLLQGVEQEFENGNDIQVDAGYTWDDNITRAKLNSDIRADSIYTFNASQTRMFFLGGNSRLLLTGAAGGERFQTYNGLSNLNLTGEAALQYRADAEYDTPTYGLLFKATALKHQSSLRDGYKYSMGLTASRPLTDRITVFGALSTNRRSANSAVFQTADTALRFNMDYSLRNHGTLYLSGEYREGDIVSTGLSSLENITLAKVLVQDDAYMGGKFFSYRFGGSTVLATLGYNIGLGARDSMDFSWRYVESTPTLRPTWATSPRSYTANQLSASYLMRF
ncbi:autotransporter domain-containing protein [Rhodoferax mekongensis]|uniref:Autotransporter domain-containing protein n=1 Tax=Rhodoferax mekongensis TaxID=3068341 RepID=A0ABZ0AZY2_9BURK|nr:autotransporter domain-containing protein [Rhodoferax sp. TBRC 17307]WNO05198.1 autotransporter domain-containing protein [Rhodoferax sp. TBRC 17307]